MTDLDGYRDTDGGWGRRVARWVFGAFLLGCLVVGLVWSLGPTIEFGGGPDGDGEVAAGEAPPEAPSEAAPSEAPGEATENQDQELIDGADPPEDTEVQVLDGSDADRTDSAITVLGEFGYEIVGPSQGRAYEETTIFYNDGERRTARALKARDERFGVVAENDRGLSEEVDIHVIIGDDWD